MRKLLGVGNLWNLQISRLIYLLVIIVSLILVLHIFAFPYPSISSPTYTYLNVDHQIISNTSLKLGSEASSILSNVSVIVYELDTQNLVTVIKGKDAELTIQIHKEETTNSSVMGIAESSSPTIPQELPTQYSVLEHKASKTITLSQMNSILLNTSASSNIKMPKRTSMPDQQLEKVRLEIQNAPILTNIPQSYASVFRNYSKFKRSYELMERLLKVYIYKEGEKPIFHQPKTRGIYASEGWFMKLMRANKQFVVKDAKKAHLFYLPFSSQQLRSTLKEQIFPPQKDREIYLKIYVEIIAKKYRYWNRTMGSDHFLVACHDWAPRFTRQTGNCIRALCNTNLASGFKIGKDVSLPVTSVRSSENPLKDIGGNTYSNRSLLVFFAGGMHGYFRPILINHWGNKESDMKIIGPMPRDLESKERYRNFMRTSKYCICARGYEVHTPRVVESIYFGCVPVIISDNYVPPFFEILNWEAFSVIILEKDVVNLRSILLSISEEKYIDMHQRLIAVQQHFLWHKVPLKYDIFHMILHSIWYNRVFQVKSG